MAIEFPCRACREWLSVNEALAGLNARCPYCSASVPVPASPSSGWSAPPAAADDRSGWGAPRRPWDDEEDPDRPEYGDPRWSDHGDFARDNSDPAWQNVRRGVHLECIAVVILICAYAGFLLVQCGLLTATLDGPGMGRGGRGTLAVLGILSLVLLLVLATGVVLMGVGAILCCLAPPGAGARGLAIAAASCLGATLLLALMVVALGVTDGFGRRSAAPRLAMLGVSGILGITAFVLYFLFLRAVAVHFGNYTLGARLVAYLVVSLALFVALLLLVFAFAAAALPRLRFGNERGVLLLWMLVQGVVTLVMLAWCSNLLAQVRDTIGKARGRWRDDYGI